MELSILIAKIISLIYLSATLGAIFNKEYYLRILDDFFKNTALAYLMGFVATIIGFLIVNYHNIWVKDWPVLITIIGWLSLFKGLSFIAFPRFIERLSKWIISGNRFKLFPFSAFFMGLLFGYFGFFCPTIY